MVTDGVLDALPVGEQDRLLETIIQGSTIANPKEMAHHGSGTGACLDGKRTG